VNKAILNNDQLKPSVILSFSYDNFIPVIILAGVLVGLAFFFGGLKMITPTHRAAIERLSRYHRFMKSGITWIIPLVDKIYPVNVTEQMANADQQEIITKDNLNAFVDVQIYFKVKEDEESVKAALYNVNDYRLQIISLSRTTLRNVIGNKEFSQVNNNRTELNKEILQSIQQQTENWGLEIVRCELKEIQPPADVQETMNTVLKAQNEKQAAIDFATARETVADGEKRAAIKQAEGQMQSAVLKAEGEAQAILKVAEARSKEIQIINEAAQKYFVGNAQVLKQLEVSETAMKDNSKFVIAEKGTNPVIVFGQEGNTNNVIVTKPKKTPI
jgi:regulator of protease activity HflC (stomatin/prohibitin superfamily)